MAANWAGLMVDSLAACSVATTVACLADSLVELKAVKMAEMKVEH